jgi:hypothetical protein
MSKYFTGNGLLTDKGKHLLLWFNQQLDDLMESDAVHFMSEAELRTLGATLTKAVGEGVSKHIADKLQQAAFLQAMTDEEFMAYMQQRYTNNWKLVSLEPEEYVRFPRAILERLVADGDYIGQTMQEYMVSIGIEVK